MAYFKINNKDFSMYVSELNIDKSNRYNAQTNAAGNTVVDFINSKRKIKVKIIPLDDATMIALTTELDKFNVSLSFRNPRTGMLEENVNCIIPNDSIDYYNLTVSRIYQPLTLTFEEL